LIIPSQENFKAPRLAEESLIVGNISIPIKIFIIIEGELFSIFTLSQSIRVFEEKLQS
jgi:hypothetical protein